MKRKRDIVLYFGFYCLYEMYAAKRWWLIFVEIREKCGKEIRKEKEVHLKEIDFG